MGQCQLQLLGVVAAVVGASVVQSTLKFLAEGPMLSCKVRQHLTPCG